MYLTHICQRQNVRAREPEQGERAAACLLQKQKWDYWPEYLAGKAPSLFYLPSLQCVLCRRIFVKIIATMNRAATSNAAKAKAAADNAKQFSGQIESATELFDRGRFDECDMIIRTMIAKPHCPWYYRTRIIPFGCWHANDFD